MVKKDIALISLHDNRAFEADATYVEDGKPKPVVIFNHGFKGFKDWGPFNIVAKQFAAAGFVFIKMNFSHNGVTREHPTEFVDLEAFARNTFSTELDDTGVLINALFAGSAPVPAREMDLNRLFLMGHSRGGAMAILKANEDDRIKKLATWAAVNHLGIWYSKEEMAYWKTAGRIYVENARTGQKMPMDYTLAEDYLTNTARLDVPAAVKNMQIHMLAIHGSADPTVPVSAVHEMKKWNPDIEVKIIEGADHVFGATHPWGKDDLPEHMRQVVDLTVDFFKTTLLGPAP